MSAEAGRRPLIPAGQVLDGRFKILDLLGEGCFGRVYRASQIAFGHKIREVALKLFNADRVTESNVADVFNDAIQLIRLNEADPSPEIERHLVRVFDIGILNTPEPQPFMSMEFIPGRKTLRSMVSRWKGAGGMPVEESLIFLRQILVPLAWMHTLECPDEPMAHGDLKPENVLMTDDQVVVLTDFGLAARVSVGTDGGDILYQPAESLDGLSGGLGVDIFAVGVMWYELLTGRNPFDGVGLRALAEGDKRAYVNEHLAARGWEIRPACGNAADDERRIAPASEFNEELEEFPQVESMLYRCLDFKESERYPNARLMLNDIDALLGGRAISMAASGVPERGAREGLPDVPEQLIANSKLLCAKGKFSEALRAADEALKKMPDCIGARLARCSALIGLGDLDTVYSELRLVKRSEPKNPDVLDTLADYYIARGKPAMAESYREDARAIRCCSGR